MDIPQNNSSKAAKCLLFVVKDIIVSTYDGEFIEQIISLMRGTTRRLKNLVKDQSSSMIPEDFMNDLVKIFQTTSVPEFDNIL